MFLPVSFRRQKKISSTPTFGEANLLRQACRECSVTYSGRLRVRSGTFLASSSSPNVSLRRYFFSPSSVFITLVVVFVFPLVGFCGDKIYVTKDKDGVVRFSTKPPREGQNAKVFKARKSGFSWYRVSKRRRSSKLFKTKYSSIIDSVSKNRGVDKHLIRAVIHAESAFYPDAVSPKGALGLMQVMPFNLRRFGISNPYDPYDNINGGTKFLAQLLKRYNGNVKFALAAYNAGENAVKKYKGIPPYKETQNYVTRVLDLWKRYEKAA